MSTTQFHHPTPARIKRFPTFVVIEAVEPAGTSVSLFFDDLDDARAWLQDALDKVQLAKAELANTQPAPVHAERESNEIARCRADEPADGFVCTLDDGHLGDHEAHGTRTDEEPDGPLVASWPQIDSARIGQPIDLTDVAVPL